MLPDTSIKLTTAYPLWLVIICFIVAAGFSLWSYRRTIPPTRNWLRWMLTLLRWGAISGGILLLAQPVMEMRRLKLEPAEVIVLVDKSASMGLTQGESDRITRVDQLLHDEAFRRLGDNFNLRLYSFTDSLGPAWDDVESLITDTLLGPGTDLGQAWIRAIDKHGAVNPAAILMISDGAHNEGADPARLARFVRTPIWTVGVGSSEAVKDLMIRSMSVNPVVYQGSEVPVEIGYRGIGAAGNSVKVILRDADGNRIESKSVRFEGDFSEAVLDFKIPVENAGRQRFSVEIERLAEELTYDNNRRSFYLNVLANRMRVLIMAGPPDQGLGDLIRRLKRDENVELTVRSTRGNRFYEGDFPDATLLERTDVLILHHFPVQSNNRKKLEAFAAEVVEKELPVGFIDGGKVSGSRLKLFEPALPIELQRERVRTLSGQVLPVRRHSVIADPDASDIASGWSELPPVLLTANMYKVKTGSTVLAEFVDSESGVRHPAIVISETGGVKSAAIMVRDLWRWGLADPGDEGIVEPLLSRLVRWLSVRKIEKRVRIAFDREIFSNQEQVSFTVTVLDENYMPLDGVDVSAEVTKDAEIGGRASLEGIGRGLYRGSFRSWGEGEYTLLVKAQLGEQLLGDDRGKVVVEPFSIELLDTRLNEELLRSIGEASGGGYVHINSADLLFNAFDFPRVEKEDVRKFQLWGKVWLLVVIIGLLTVEWFIRIRTGML